MWYFCKYKYILGEPKKGLHSYRVFNIAIVDVLLTFILAKFIQYYIMEESELSLILVFCFIAGVILHRVFCVKTTIDKLLFS
tara:strand:+ start:2276 stop:2521 length:246 start_codon:yes stop_codon:yes gene_type:complete